MNWTKLLLSLLLLVPSLAAAQQDYPLDLTVSWVNATEYVDGTLIETGDLEFVRIEVYRGSDPIPTMTATIPDNGEGASQVEVFAAAITKPGTYVITGFSIVVGGAESDPSIPVTRKYTGKPRPPVIATVEVS